MRRINLWLRGEGNGYDVTATFPLILSSNPIGHAVKSRQCHFMRIIIIKIRGLGSEHVMNVSLRVAVSAEVKYPEVRLLAGAGKRALLYIKTET